LVARLERLYAIEATLLKVSGALLFVEERPLHRLGSNELRGRLKLADKRVELGAAKLGAIVRIYGDPIDSEVVEKIFLQGVAIEAAPIGPINPMP
jgi:hypothetical protein